MTAKMTATAARVSGLLWAILDVTSKQRIKSLSTVRLRDGGLNECGDVVRQLELKSALT
jgi:hypothetical protein